MHVRYIAQQASLGLLNTVRIVAIAHRLKMTNMKKCHHNSTTKTKTQRENVEISV